MLTDGGWRNAEDRQTVDGLVKVMTCMCKKTTKKVHQALTTHHSYRSLAYDLNGVCLQIPSDELQGRVADLLEGLFLSDPQTLGSFGYTAVMVLLSRATTKSQCTRLWKAREGLLYIDQLDCSSDAIDFVTGRLASCFCLGRLLKWEEGRKFLAFLLSSLNADIAHRAVMTVREAIAKLKHDSPILHHNSWILFHGWKSSRGQIRTTIFSHLDELGQSTIHCEPLYAAKCRELLKEFFNNRSAEGMPEVFEMLSTHVMGHLNVANWKTRFNATTMLCHCFPLADPDSPDYNETLDLEYASLRALCTNTHHEVRRAAAVGVGRVLNKYWEMVPTDQLNQFLDLLFNKLSKDAASPLVRVAAVEGLGVILDNPLSHPLLLPKLADLVNVVNDRSPAVRLAFVSLHKKVRSIRGATPLVPRCTLLARLAKEQMLARFENFQKEVMLDGPHPPARRTNSARTVLNAISEVVLQSTNFESGNVPDRVKLLKEMCTENLYGTIAFAGYPKMPLSDSLRLVAGLLMDAGRMSREQKLKASDKDAARIFCLLESAVQILSALRVQGLAASGRKRRNCLVGADLKHPGGVFKRDFFRSQLQDEMFAEAFVEGSPMHPYLDSIVRLLLELDVLPRTQWKVEYPLTFEQLTRAFSATVKGKSPVCTPENLVELCSRWDASPACKLDAAWGLVRCLQNLRKEPAMKRQKTSSKKQTQTDFTKANRRDTALEVLFLERCWRNPVLARSASATSGMQGLAADLLAALQTLLNSAFFLKPEWPPLEDDPLMYLGFELTVAGPLLKNLCRFLLTKHLSGSGLETVLEEEEDEGEDEVSFSLDSGIVCLVRTLASPTTPHASLLGNQPFGPTPRPCLKDASKQDVVDRVGAPVVQLYTAVIDVLRLALVADVALQATTDVASVIRNAFGWVSLLRDLTDDYSRILDLYLETWRASAGLLMSATNAVNCPLLDSLEALSTLLSFTCAAVPLTDVQQLVGIYIGKYYQSTRSMKGLVQRLLMDTFPEAVAKDEGRSEFERRFVTGIRTALTNFDSRPSPTQIRTPAEEFETQSDVSSMKSFQSEMQSDLSSRSEHSVQKSGLQKLLRI
ncbi:MAG: uncharacterized protein KVP18_002726 [Porospora cf. gigantea A]|nr:MAG: hypothetical protein KVP18_002726 [Porospora cf. gigantea A]